MEQSSNPEPQERAMSGRDYLARENEARENHNSLNALHFAEQAFEAFINEGDLIGASESCAAQSITYRHLSDKLNDPNYKIKAKHVAMAGADIARNSGQNEALAIPLFGVGRTLFGLEEYEEAKELFEEALDRLPESPHNRPSVDADLRNHLEVTRYVINGDESAIDRALQAVDDIKNTDENQYEKDVWSSGGLMRIADAIYAKYPQRARNLLAEAREIIEGNPDLKIRREQLEKLEAELQ